MNYKKLNAYLSKELRKIGKDLKREKARCARLYPDWRDDEYNMLDNQFIWGYNDDPTVVPSFYSWDDAYIYYNRASKLYFMTIDIGFYDASYNDSFARVAMGRLSKIKNAFEDFLIKNDFPLFDPIFPCNDPALEAESLSQLYFKFRLFYEGYKSLVTSEGKID